MSDDVVLSLGSNLGDSLEILRGALVDLARVSGVEPYAVSSVYETDPVGGPEQDAYLNAVVLARCTLAPQDLLAQTQRIEAAWHRTREVRWGPRTLDIDIVTMDGHVLTTVSLELPHPRAHERAFVLVPWLEVDPEAVLLGRGAIADLVAGLDSSSVRRTDSALPLPRGTSA
ncbi:MAG: 2-amino-4-hydroxy-6-hydroxymethyldihydropteridine diphosphokinase [Actinomycetales bacterium]|nr:2-amino-4-hydroxy-6-hydroxymethyldihydropteridine diphosphokinase [Actinomycetales bacterium]